MNVEIKKNNDFQQEIILLKKSVDDHQRRSK